MLASECVHVNRSSVTLESLTLTEQPVWEYKLFILFNLKCVLHVNWQLVTCLETQIFSLKFRRRLVVHLNIKKRQSCYEYMFGEDIKLCNFRAEASL